MNQDARDQLADRLDRERREQHADPIYLADRTPQTIHTPDGDPITIRPIREGFGSLNPCDPSGRHATHDPPDKHHNPDD